MADSDSIPIADSVPDDGGHAARVHAGTQRVVQEHFQEERPSLLALPAGRFDAVLRQERRVSSEGCVSVGGNYYSVPDGNPPQRDFFVLMRPSLLRIYKKQEGE